MTRAVGLPLLAISIMCVPSLWRRQRWRAVCWSIALTAFVVMTQVELSSFPKIVGSHKNGQVPFAIAVWLLALLPWLMPSRWSTIFHRSEEKRHGTSYWLFVGAVLLLFSALMRGHHGGFTNVLMPGLWVLCIVIPLISCPTNTNGLLLSSLCSVNWVGGQRRIWIPTTEDRLAGDALVAELSASGTMGTILHGCQFKQVILRQHTNCTLGHRS